MFIDSVRILGVIRKEPTLISTRGILKIDKARDKRKKLISQGWRRTKPVWEGS